MNFDVRNFDDTLLVYADYLEESGNRLSDFWRTIGEITRRDEKVATAMRKGARTPMNRWLRGTKDPRHATKNQRMKNTCGCWIGSDVMAWQVSPAQYERHYSLVPCDENCSTNLDVALPKEPTEMALPLAVSHKHNKMWDCPLLQFGAHQWANTKQLGFLLKRFPGATMCMPTRSRYPFSFWENHKVIALLMPLYLPGECQ